jgi:serine/threonine-protein kinase
MAIIHLAKDHLTNSQCVIKVARLDTVHPIKVNSEKLKIEADFLRTCNHPQIVRFVDQFTSQSKVFHLVEEYIDGSDLLAVFSRSTADERRAIKLTVQILDALDYIHRSGRMHRDLNPKNIMLNRDDNVVLIDFGTIKNTGDPSHTRLGTPGFESPEILTKGFTDERSDVYGVGSILFYMLTSQRIGYIGDKKLIEFLSSKGISQRTAKCVDQALQMDPAFRFHTVAVMRSALLGG